MEVLDILLTNVLLFASLIGMGVGFGSMDRRLGNSPLMWVATIWNLILLAMIFLLMVAGLLMGG